MVDGGLADLKVSAKRAQPTLRERETPPVSALSPHRPLSFPLPLCPLLPFHDRSRVRVAFERNRSIIVRIRGAARHRTAANSAEVAGKRVREIDRPRNVPRRGTGTPLPPPPPGDANISHAYIRRAVSLYISI